MPKPSVMKETMKRNAPKKKTGRPKDMSLPHIETIESAYKRAIADFSHLSSIGWTRLVLPPSIKPTAGKKVLAMLKGGKSAREIASAKAESRKWSAGAKRNPQYGKRVKKLLSKNNSATENSQRLMARKLG